LEALIVTLVPPPDPIVFTVRLPALLRILGVQPVRGRRKLVTSSGPPTHRTTGIFFSNEGISPLFLNTRPSKINIGQKKRSMTPG
jgi:hypothetical protein